MPIADLTPSAKPEITDDVCTARLIRVLIRTLESNRNLLQRISNVIVNAPGGKAGCLTCLGTDQTEAVAILDKLVTLLNTHKAAGIADVINPLS